MSKDFEDHLQSWYGLLICGLLATAIGFIILVSAFAVYWNQNTGWQAELWVYLMGIGFLAILAGLGALGWASAKLGVKLVAWVKKLSIRK